MKIRFELGNRRTPRNSRARGHSTPKTLSAPIAARRESAAPACLTAGRAGPTILEPRWKHHGLAIEQNHSFALIPGCPAAIYLLGLGLL